MQNSYTIAVSNLGQLTICSCSCIGRTRWREREHMQLEIISLVTRLKGRKEEIKLYYLLAQTVSKITQIGWPSFSSYNTSISNLVIYLRFWNRESILDRTGSWLVRLCKEVLVVSVTFLLILRVLIFAPVLLSSIRFWPFRRWWRMVIWSCSSVVFASVDRSSIPAVSFS